MLSARRFSTAPGGGVGAGVGVGPGVGAGVMSGPFGAPGNARAAAGMPDAGNATPRSSSLLAPAAAIAAPHSSALAVSRYGTSAITRPFTLARVFSCASRVRVTTTGGAPARALRAATPTFAVFMTQVVRAGSRGHRFPTGYPTSTASDPVRLRSRAEYATESTITALTPVALTSRRYFALTAVLPGSWIAQICRGSFAARACPAPTPDAAIAISARTALSPTIVHDPDTAPAVPSFGKHTQCATVSRGLRVRQLASARPLSETIARVPPSASDESTASIIRTTSRPSFADERGGLPDESPRRNRSARAAAAPRQPRAATGCRPCGTSACTRRTSPGSESRHQSRTRARAHSTCRRRRPSCASHRSSSGGASSAPTTRSRRARPAPTRTRG